MDRRSRCVVACAICFALISLSRLHSRAEEPAKPVDEKPQAARPAPKELADYTKKGLTYLAGQQNDDGGWGQGGGWRTGQGGRVEGAEVKDPSDMGNTCVAVLALLRAGNLPGKGEYGNRVAKGIEFICKHVEGADSQSIWVTDVRDTQLQSKIGQYVDTFAAALVLSELKGQVAAEQGGSRIEAALKKVIAKIETNQKEDGTFAGNNGWASVLSQGLASKALNRAVQKGVAVNDEVLKRDFAQAGRQLAAAGAISAPVAESASVPVAGKPVTAGIERSVETRSAEIRSAARAGAADAGVKLYNFSANGGRLADFKNTKSESRKKAEVVLADKSAPKEAKDQARAEIDAFAKVAASQQEALDDIVKRLDDKQFLAGFGNNGGEEFLSYMNISETVMADGGKAWDRWNRAVGDAVAKVQNDDGSWSGHHCITGRTFCTSAALLTLMADRAPVPVAVPGK
jgi:hypothetical protein